MHVVTLRRNGLQPNRSFLDMGFRGTGRVLRHSPLFPLAPERVYVVLQSAAFSRQRVALGILAAVYSCAGESSTPNQPVHRLY